jgi:hypothetical protein
VELIADQSKDRLCSSLCERLNLNTAEADTLKRCGKYRRARMMDSDNWMVQTEALAKRGYNKPTPPFANHSKSPVRSMTVWSLRKDNDRRNAKFSMSSPKTNQLDKLVLVVYVNRW